MIDNFFLERNNTALVIIDFQEKLALSMKYRDEVLGNIKKFIVASKILDFPIILTEQYPKGIGPTENEIIYLLPDYNPFVKTTFSCCGDSEFLRELERLNKKSLILAGIEAHVCVLQTALDCIKRGYSVHIPVDSVASREKLNWKTGLDMMKEAGAIITSTEIAIFQLLNESGTKEFKELHKYIK